MPRFDTPLNTNDHSLDRMLNAGLPVALVLYRGEQLDSAISDTLLNVAKHDAGRVLVAKLNTDENPSAGNQYGGGPLPALVTFRDGQPVTRAGNINTGVFRAHVDHLLGRGPAPAQNAAPRAPQQPATPNTGQPNAPARPITVTDDTFQSEVLASDVPVLVDLWAPWCGPCRMIAPILEKLAPEYASRMKIVKLNVDENPFTAQHYQVQGIPTLLMFKHGRVVDRIVGAAPEQTLRQRIQVALHR